MTNRYCEANATSFTSARLHSLSFGMRRMVRTEDLLLLCLIGPKHDDVMQF